MNESKIAVRYAKALFLSAQEQNLIDEVRKDMILVLELCGMDDFRDVIDSPVIPNSKKRQVMTALFKTNVNEVTYSLITLAVNNNREAFLPGIARSFIARANRHEGITPVTLTTAVKINSNNRQSFIDIIEKDLDTRADLDEVINEDISGGYILKVGDLYVDASLKTRLRKIRNELINKQ
ncbi:MAG: ATP synthase F1 subunit delta [Bacteroidales bacterium]|nr:ATP synthase F1 subunit delta [Bacteroidales bacterium]